METNISKSSHPNVTPTESPPHPFVYTALPDAAKHIRLLKILEPLAEVGPANFELEVHPVDNLPSYSAISYVWGDNKEQHVITLNGQCMTIYGNARYALWQAVDEEEDDSVEEGVIRYLWMDAICINQSDLEEKGAQVAMMADIYRLATQVAACLGRNDGDSKTLTKVFRTDAILDAQKYEGAVQGPSASGSASYLSDSVSEIATDWLLCQDEEYLASICEAFAGLAHREYWSRMWIAQELCMGQNCLVLCGKDAFEINDILFFDKVFEDLLDLELGVYCRFIVEAAWAHASEGFMRRALQLQPNSREKLGCTLERLKDFKCRDPRDRLYALNAMVWWGEGRERLKPDYNKSTFDVLVQAIEHINPSVELDTTTFTERPSELVTFSVLEALQIDASDHQIRSGVARRQQDLNSGYASPHNSSLLYEYAYAFGRVSEAKQGELIISFRQVDYDQSEEADELLRMFQGVAKGSCPSYAIFEGRMPKRLRVGSSIAGLACHETQEGDVLLPFAATQSIAEAVAQIYIVIRKDDTTSSCRVVGQAIVFAHYEPSTRLPTWEEYHDPDRFVVTPGPVFEIALTAEDLIILSGQDFLREGQGHLKGGLPSVRKTDVLVPDAYWVPRSFDMHARLQRLVTSVTLFRGCGARILETPSDVQRYRAIESACSFGQVTQSKMGRRTRFRQDQTLTGFVFMPESEPIRSFAGPFYHATGEPCPVHGLTGESRECDAPSRHVTEPRITWRPRYVECKCHAREKITSNTKEVDQCDAIH